MDDNYWFDLNTDEGIDSFIEKMAVDTYWKLKKEEYKRELNYFVNDPEAKAFRLGIMKESNRPILVVGDIRKKGREASTVVAVFRNDVLLKNHHIQDLISADEIYKHLSNFIAYELNNDKNEPPVEVTNKDKIIKAGFDVKKSFRHRK